MVRSPNEDLVFGWVPPPKLVLSFCPKFIGLKLKRQTPRLVASVTLQRAYEDVSILLDGPLQSVLCGRRSMQSLDRLDRLVPRPFVVSDDRL